MERKVSKVTSENIVEIKLCQYCNTNEEYRLCVDMATQVTSLSFKYGRGFL